MMRTMGVSDAKTEKVQILDKCDPATFNAEPPVGPGLEDICDKDFNGGVSFEEFSELLTPSAFGHPTGRFNAPYLEIEPHEKVRVTNRGGEDHMFTEVPETFGGGRIEGLNTALGLKPLDECQYAAKAPVLHPGDS